MAELPFVDTHVHFRTSRTRTCTTLAPARLEAPHPGDIEAIQAQRYWADDFVAETRFSNVSKSIHVQAALGIKDPVEETKWLQAFADRLGHPHGIVAEVHLAAGRRRRRSSSATWRTPTCAACATSARATTSSTPTWRRGFALLEEHDLVACLDSSPETYAKMRVARRGVPRHRHLARPRRLPAQARRRVLRDVEARAGEPRGRPERGHQDLRPGHVRPRAGRSTRFRPWV